MRISDWSSDVCSSDLDDADQPPVLHHGQMPDPPPGDEPERAERRLIPRHRYGGRGHHLVDTPVEDRRPVLGKAADDVALGKYAHHRVPAPHRPRPAPPFLTQLYTNGNLMVGPPGSTPGVLAFKNFPPRLSLSPLPLPTLTC